MNRKFMNNVLNSRKLGFYFMTTVIFLALISTSMKDGLIKTTYGYGYGYINNKVENPIQNITNTVLISSTNKSHKKEDNKKEKDLKNSRNSVRKGETLIQSGKGFKKNSKLNLYFSKPDGTFYPPVTIKTNADGKFSIKYLVTKPVGKYKWYAVIPSSGKKTKTSSYTIVK